MPSPSTHQVPGWPVEIIGRKRGKPSPVFLLAEAPTEENWESETYTPVSALLSDEVVETVARRMVADRNKTRKKPLVWDARSGKRLVEDAMTDREKEAYRSGARRYLQAAIEQVGGGQE